MKKIFGTMALAGLLGFAACGGQDEEIIIEAPVVEESLPAPVISEPMTPAAPLDSAAMAPMMDSAAVPTTPAP